MRVLRCVYGCVCDVDDDDVDDDDVDDDDDDVDDDGAEDEEGEEAPLGLHTYSASRSHALKHPAPPKYHTLAKISSKTRSRFR